MGNMGYPVITRVGINQFWYKHWYSDLNRVENIKQDKIFEELLLLYLNYGISFRNNVFFHEYFFTKSSKPVRLENISHNFKYYRSFSYSNTALTIEHSFLLRIRAGEYFPLRLWHIKYNGWVLLFFNCFRPFKSKLKTFDNGVSREVSALATETSYAKRTLRRFKVLYLYMKRRFSKSKLYQF
jgi:hypothetical protein